METIDCFQCFKLWTLSLSKFIFPIYAKCIIFITICEQHLLNYAYAVLDYIKGSKFVINTFLISSDVDYINFCPLYLVKMRLEESTIKSFDFLYCFIWKSENLWKYSFRLQKVVKTMFIQYFTMFFNHFSYSLHLYSLWLSFTFVNLNKSDFIVMPLFSSEIVWSVIF